MRALHAGQVSLGGIILLKFGLDIIVNCSDFLLESVYKLGDGFVGAIFDLIPLEGLKVVLDRSWRLSLALQIYT